MAKFNIDVKKFKHVSSDDKSTTLRHKDGHEMKIFHKALSPEFQEQLAALSKSSKDESTEKMSKGGEVNPKLEQSKKVRPKFADGGKVEIPQQQKAYAIGLPPDAGMNTINNAYSAWALNHPEAHQQLMIQEQMRQQEAIDRQNKQNAINVANEMQRNKQLQFQKKFNNPAEEQAAMSSLANQANYDKQQKSRDTAIKTDEEAYQAKQNKLDEPVDESGYTNYDAGGEVAGPCLNPNCKSNGKPHPNCRCYMADGGKVQHVCSAKRHHYHDCEHYINMAEGEEVPPPQDPAMQASPDIDTPPPQEQPQNIPTTPQPNDQAQPEQQPSLPSPTQDQDLSADPMAMYQAHKDQHLKNALDHDAEWDQDLRNGHISPQTYQSMYAKKDTLGKIGTIFGLMLGGIGSGLTHGPNVALEMMNNTIKNDLEAQEKSKDNARNYLKLSQEYVLNKENAKNLNIRTQTEAYALANMTANRAALHTLIEKTSAMPEGPLKVQAMQQLAALSQAVQTENYQIADRAATQTAYYQMLGIGAGPEQNKAEANEETFKKQQQAMQMMGPQGQALSDYRTQRHIPGIDGFASRPIPEDARNRIQAMNVLDAKGKDLLSYVHQNLGTMNPQKRAVAEQKAEEMKNFYNDSIKGGALTQGRLKWYDEQFSKSPTSIISNVLGSTKKLEEMVRSNSMRKDMELYGPGGLGFPAPAQKQETAKPQGPPPKPGYTVQEYNGKQYYVPIKK